MRKPDYKSYTTEDLYDVLNHIDKDNCPENYQALMEELENRKALPQDDTEESKELSASFSKPYQYDDSDLYDTLSPEQKTNCRYVAGILFLNAILVFFQILFIPDVIAGSTISPIIVDITLGLLLFFRPSKVAVNIMIFRAVIGVIFHGIGFYNNAAYLDFALQIVYGGGIIFLLTLVSLKKARNVVVGLVLAVQISLLAISINAAYISNNLDTIYTLENSRIEELSGFYYDYSIPVPAGGDWYLRDRNAAIKDNPMVDQWMVNAEKDAHVMVIAEDIGINHLIGYPELKEQVLANARQASPRLKVLADTTTANEFHQGCILHTKSNINLLDVDFLHGIYLIGDKAFQVVAFCGSDSFEEMRDTLEAMVNTFHYTGEVRNPLERSRI